MGDIANSGKKSWNNGFKLVSFHVEFLGSSSSGLSLLSSSLHGGRTELGCTKDVHKVIDFTVDNERLLAGGILALQFEIDCTVYDVRFAFCFLGIRYKFFEKLLNEENHAVMRNIKNYSVVLTNALK